MIKSHHISSHIPCVTYWWDISHVTYGYVVSHINESRHIWMSHGTHDQVTSRILAHTVCHILMRHVTCHIWLCRVTYKWVTAHMNESRHTWSSHVTYPRTYLASHIDETCHILMRHVTCRIWPSCVTYKLSHVRYEWVTSHMNESCHVWMRHVTYDWVV